MTHPDVLVLGGGVIGLAVARELALQGLRVEVVERLPAGSEASLASAGMLLALGDPGSPRPFVEACLASRDLWASWVAALESETGLSVDYDRSGSLVVALERDPRDTRDDKDEEALDRVLAAAREAGEAVHEIGIAELRRRVPDISRRVRRALHLPGDHRVDNVQLCAVLAQAVQKLGATIHYDSEAVRVERRPEGTVLVSGNHWRKEARLLVLAAGAWSGRLPDLPTLPVRPVRGQIVLLGGIAWPWSGSLHRGQSYVVRRGATGLLVGSTLEESGFDKHNTVDGIEELLAFARELLPGIGRTRLETVWAGLRPGTPDDLPILGRLPGWPAIAATGHYRNGILLAPWTAREVARLATTRDEEIPAFSPRRFLPGA